ncbi:mannitol 2-dehydrogenase [Oceanicella actignis]|uniref:Mannitol 2-dehydrogenase n=2 Tax=Oceanicella actignis TaxID=1189325 RepID=A0A1M7TCD7_9RHOB|nr:mannitol 2-dehydrogenase [Oceanicella actignis]SHN68390.1 mannitol 2-dehydrogenase [Oceanicella actignis]
MTAPLAPAEERPADERTMSMNAPVKLSQAALPHLPSHVGRPRYDRAALRAGIVHVGVGNFHRAHQGWHLHRLMQQGLAQDWAVIGAGVRPQDEAMRARLSAQDWLTTLIELRPEGPAAEVIGPMIGFAPPAEDSAPLIAAMSDPAIRIVSLTVTEGGYFVDPAGGFDAAHPDIRRDAADPARPRTVFGAIVAAMARRRAQGLAPFTVMSCDNLQGNGAAARRAVTGLARMSDPALADWIEAEGAFPNSMVDCIVPATGPDELALARRLGVEDAAPVTHENYRQWVIEDRFCAGRPELERVGVIFSDAVHDYELLKIRVLNAGHQVLANAGELLGLATIADCMAHPLIGAMFRRVEMEEICPHAPDVPGTSAQDYARLIERRFANPAIRDSTRRVAHDGASRHPAFVLPILREALAAGAPVEGLSLVEALWARMCAGVREDGSAIAPNDPIWDQLQTAAQAARERSAAWLEQRRIYGDLAEAPRFAEAFARWLDLIWARGTAEALRIHAQQGAAPAA